MAKTVLLIPPRPPVSFYHFPRLFTANTRATLPKLIMETAKPRNTAKFCPTAWALLCCRGNPASKNMKRRVGCVLVVMCWRGGAWCHLVAWRGPIKPWENYVTFCWAGPFRPIEVQWIESCREVIFSLSCVCVWEKAGEKKKKGGGGE